MSSISRVLAMVGCTLLLAGCAQLNVNKPIEWPWKTEEKPKEPGKILAMWTDTVRHETNGASTRGFGGRLIFYGEGKEKDKPVKIDGRLEVYAFEEDPQNPNKVKPDRKYVFTKEQIPLHYSKSDLGHSYSFWLPWDPAGGPQQEVTLIARFLPADGDLVIGEPTRHLLPGVNTPPAIADTRVFQQPQTQPDAPNGVQPVSYDAPTTGLPQSPSDVRAPHQLNTTTIEVPSRFGQPAPVAVPGAHHETRTAVTGQAARGWPATQAAPAGTQTAHSAAGLGAGIPRAATQPATAPQQARFSPARSRPLGGSIDQLSRDHGPWQPRPAVSPPRQGPQPGPATGSEATGYGPGAQPGPYAGY